MKAERASAQRRSDAKGTQQAIVQRAAAGSKGDPETGGASDPPAVLAEMRREMIATTAYFRAERRGFQGGDLNEDWLAAEAEVDVLIRERGKPAAGRGMESRAAFEERLEAQLREWDKKLDELAAAARRVKTGARKEMEAQIETLGVRRAALRDQLESLRRQTANAWSDLREGIEKAWEDMRKAVENIQRRFK